MHKGLANGPDKQTKNERKILKIFLSIRLNICSGRSKEPSLRDSPFEYPQHMFLLINTKIIFNDALLFNGNAIFMVIVMHSSYHSGMTL